MTAISNRPLSALLFCLCASQTAGAAGIAPRIAGPIDDEARVVLAGSQPPLAVAERDLGALAADERIEGASLVLDRTDAQKADLAALIAAQHDPASPAFHRWLTPEQFGARFGAADGDIARLSAWLESQQLTVDGVSRARDRIRFSGTAAQIATAFGTQLHRFQAGASVAYAPAGAVTVPAAFGGVVRAVQNLSSFRPQRHLRPMPPRPAPDFTSSQTGNHFLSPADVATIYDLAPSYAAGFDGGGQSIAVIGQSAIAAVDIERFQAAAGIPVHDPVQILVPGTGTSKLVTGDEAEADLDLEYTSSIAPGATVSFVYTGNSQNNGGAFTALQYAVDNNVAAIISSSFGSCEAQLSTADYNTLEGILSQAAAQGQTVVSASGDSGSTDCGTNTLVVDYPASSAFVTGVGGTEFTDAAVAGGSSFWKPATSGDVIGSALSYMPEQVWNDDAPPGQLAAGGGGTSARTPRPSWQVGVPGIATTGTQRLVPDVSLSSSGVNAGYLFCSSDNAETKVTGSCSNGFRDASNVNLTVAGGTSFAAPVVAGMLAVLEQRLSSQRQGLVNQALYSIASDPTQYASAFHDITAGTNACVGIPAICTVTSFAAGAGYDEATGLGSIDFENLAGLIPRTTPVVLGSRTTLTGSATVLPGASDEIAITVAPFLPAAAAVPGGNVTVSVDGAPAGQPLPLVAGAANFLFAPAANGAHTVTAIYSGDAVFAASQASMTIRVTSATFALIATDTSLASGGSGSSNVTITPGGAYQGTISWTVSASPALGKGCFALDNAVVASDAAVTATLRIDTGAACATALLQRTKAARWAANGRAQPASPMLAGFIFAIPWRRRRRRGRRGHAGLFALAAVCFGLASCGSNSSGAAKGAYAVRIVGTDTVDQTITASTQMTLTIR
jgi:hypothetical protein